jgi:hypothetical protein
MYHRLFPIGLTVTLWLAASGSAIAGPYDVTFQVPLNLTGLSPTITKVRVSCTIYSSALPGGALASVHAFVDRSTTGGQVVSTATVVVPVTSLDTSGGRTSANYMCRLTGFSQTQGEGRFDSAATNPVFRIAPTPADISGSFNW